MRLFTLLALLTVLDVSAQTTQSTTIPAPTADFELREWAVFVAEPLAPRANAVSAIKSTLPTFVTSKRPDAQGPERAAVMPIGVIRIVGGKTPSPKFDVLLNVKAGELVGAWPKAESRGTRLLWSNLVADDAKPTLSQLDPKHWMSRLRDGESRYLTSGRESRGERFLLYDAEPAFTVPLRVEASDEGYRVSNAGASDMLNLELYKSKDGAWRKGFAKSLTASRAATKPSTQPADTSPPKIKPGDVLTISLDYSQNIVAERERSDKVSDAGDFMLPVIGNIRVTGKTAEQIEKDIQKRFTDSGIGLNKISVTLRPKEDVAPTTGPTGPGVDLAMSDEKFADPAQLLAGWKDRLGEAGLADVDVNLILDILSKYAIDAGRLTAVYMLDRDRMDELLPEEIVPQPAKITRVGLVIVRNIDPAINQEIAALVKLLGDDDWAKREEAQKKLTALGRAAKSALEKATREKDMEIVWRAEAVLRSIDPQRFPGANN